MRNEKKSRKKRNRQAGVGFTEYIILIGVIAVGLIFTITSYKEELRVTVEGGQSRVDSGVRTEMTRDRDDREDRDDERRSEEENDVD